MTTLTLLQLNNLVRQTLEYSMVESYWVEAEISDCHDYSGHCYMELVQKDEFSNTPIAKARAQCWRNNWQKIRPRFEQITGQSIHSGMKVLMKVKANFHEAYGFSWIINDIDATYTMGDLARRRLEIIRTLKEEGVFDLNKSLEVPMFAKRIAVISSQSAAGYGDFCNQLEDNDYGFKFQTRLFPAIMQGEMVEESVIAALNSINEVIDDFDVVVIIRGGGASSDLSGFDTLALAENVANFPLPVITGIGHERDESVLDLISCVKVKTPTAAAAFLIDNLARTLDAIESAGQRIAELVRAKMNTENMRIARYQSFLPVAFSLRKTQENTILTRLSDRIQRVISIRLQAETNRIDAVSSRIPLLVNGKLEKEKHRLELLEHRASAVDPIHILRKGYSIALHDGIALTDPKDVQMGDSISIVMANGIVLTRVIE